jgi:hypothetical protein
MGGIVEAEQREPGKGDIHGLRRSDDMSPLGCRFTLPQRIKRLRAGR